jgi:DNA-binding GntR family transcriptional regulator
MALRPGDGARTLADAAFAALREAIVSGEIPPGSPIRLQEYVERLSMSTVPIREALRFLEQHGLIERRPHRGVVVSEMSATDLQDTYDLRLDLESMAVRKASQHITPEDREMLLGLVGEYEASLRADDGSAPDVHTKLHMTIYDFAGSRLLRLLLPILWDNSERYRRLQLSVRGSIADRVEEHRALVEACCSGDPARAEKELRAHLGRTMNGAVALLREREDGGSIYGVPAATGADSSS